MDPRPPHLPEVPRQPDQTRRCPGRSPRGRARRRPRPNRPARPRLRPSACRTARSPPPSRASACATAAAAGKAAGAVPPGSHAIQVCIHCRENQAGFWVAGTGGKTVAPWCLSCRAGLDRDRCDIIRREAGPVSTPDTTHRYGVHHADPDSLRGEGWSSRSPPPPFTPVPRPGDGRWTKCPVSMRSSPPAHGCGRDPNQRVERRRLSTAGWLIWNGQVQACGHDDGPGVAPGSADFGGLSAGAGRGGPGPGDGAGGGCGVRVVLSLRQADRGLASGSRASGQQQVCAGRRAA